MQGCEAASGCHRREIVHQKFIFRCRLNDGNVRPSRCRTQCYTAVLHRRFPAVREMPCWKDFCVAGLRWRREWDSHPCPILTVRKSGLAKAAWTSHQPENRSTCHPLAHIEKCATPAGLFAIASIVIAGCRIQVRIDYVLVFLRLTRAPFADGGGNGEIVKVRRFEATAS